MGHTHAFRTASFRYNPLPGPIVHIILVVSWVGEWLVLSHIITKNGSSVTVHNSQLSFGFVLDRDILVGDSIGEKCKGGIPRRWLGFDPRPGKGAPLLQKLWES